MLGLAEAATSARFAITRVLGTTGDLDNGNIFRQASLTEVTDLEPTTGTGQPALGRLAEYFKMGQPPYEPMAVLEVGNTLTVRYAAPSPLGLLP